MRYFILVLILLAGCGDSPTEVESKRLAPDDPIIETLPLDTVRTP